jgi:alanine racemase
MGGDNGVIVHIDLAAFDRNLSQVKARVGKREIIAVVKADAYGHGAVAVARFLSERATVRPGMLAVATLSEAITLREADICLPILLLSGYRPAFANEVVAHQITPVIFDADHARSLRLAVQAMPTPIPVDVHIKIDTGMGRLGVAPDEAPSFIEAAMSQGGVRVTGILSHLADADDLEFSRQQAAHMEKIRAGIPFPVRCHLANSVSIMHLDFAHFDAVRPGLALYGYLSTKQAGAPALTPVMQVTAPVLAVKTHPAGTPIGYGRTHTTRRVSRIATIGIGYSGGYPRLLSNRGAMLASGRRVPVVGRVCMDMTMIDVTDVPELKPGDRVTVVGTEKGTSIWADELAAQADTIAYELLCALGNNPNADRHVNFAGGGIPLHTGKDPT